MFSAAELATDPKLQRKLMIFTRQKGKFLQGKKEKMKLVGVTVQITDLI
jgi:hypothetical protein